LDLGVSGGKHTITCDDTEFGGRLMAQGEKIFYYPPALLYHPVDPSRATKKYFLNWYYYNGVSLVRTDGLPTEGIFYFGVPRWFFGDLLRNMARWLITFDSTRRFRHKLRTCRSLGYIAEGFRLSRAKRDRLSTQLEAS
jgi:GT2 family glycosyltransferase